MTRNCIACHYFGVSLLALSFISLGNLMLYVSIIILLDGNLKADPSWFGIVFHPKNCLTLSFEDQPSPIYFYSTGHLCFMLQKMMLPERLLYFQTFEIIKDKILVTECAVPLPMPKQNFTKHMSQSTTKTAPTSTLKVELGPCQCLSRFQSLSYQICPLFMAFQLEAEKFIQSG